jgi:hypothetical protein
VLSWCPHSSNCRKKGSAQGWLQCTSLKRLQLNVSFGLQQNWSTLLSLSPKETTERWEGEVENALYFPWAEEITQMEKTILE